MQNTKTKRVFQLRKTGPIARQPTSQQNRPIDQQEQSSPALQNQRPSIKQQYIMANDSIKIDNQSQLQRQTQQMPLNSQPDIAMDEQQLHFYQKIGNVQVKNIRIKNTGSSAIYYEWAFKNLPKINANAIKDPKPNFYCHYQPNVIKPGHQQIFSFSFFSQTPGVFVEEVQLVCQPQPTTPIAPIKLKGVAYIQDILKSKRQNLAKDLKQKVTQVFVKQVVLDTVNMVKNPVPPLPDVSNPEIAQKQFQQNNANQKLYYNTAVHKFFNNLYHDICNANQIPQQSRHWDQSVSQLNQLIQKVNDSILRESFDKRLQNYKLLSSTKPPQKSDLFPKVKQILLQTGYALGGAVADESKKQLQMWQIPFQQPKQTQTQQQKTAKKAENAKIIAQWAKKMKKKKWGQQQEKQMLNNYKGKLEKGVSKTLILKFDGFDEQADYQSCRVNMKQKFEPKRYFGFLQRLKTVRQSPIEGKKILLKFDLKLKNNCNEQLIKLEQYLQKKKQQQLRAQQQKKNQQANKAKKKAAPVKKKKGQKEQEQQKVLSFDFNTILDQQSWQGFIQSLKFILQKQPMLLILGISYGPKTGVFNEKFSVKFLLQCLKAVEPAIQFLEHKDMFQLKKKIEEETLNEGSIYLTQNLSFLPCQGMEAGQLKVIQKVVDGETKKIQTIQSHKMLMSQVENQLSQLMPAIDIIVREDRFVNRVSGLCSYGKRDCILGLTWWKYIAFALRTQKSFVLLGGSFSPQKLVLISKMLRYCSRIHLVGELGLKIWMCVNNYDKFYGVNNNKNEQTFIKQFLEYHKDQNTLQNIILPLDYILSQSKDGQTVKTTYNTGEKHEGGNQGIMVVDVGTKTCQELEKLQQGHLFIIDYPAIDHAETGSLKQISRLLLNKKQIKKTRHLQQQTTPAGINYQKDLVIYLVGIEEEVVEKIQLKDKKIKQKQGEQQQWEQQAEPEPQQNQIKKIDLISDFRISDTEYFQKLLGAEFSYGLKDICKYVKSD